MSYFYLYVVSYFVHEYAMIVHHKFVSDVAFNDVMIPFVWSPPPGPPSPPPAGYSPYYYANYGAAEPQSLMSAQYRNNHCKSTSHTSKPQTQLFLNIYGFSNYQVFIVLRAPRLFPRVLIDKMYLRLF